MEIEKSIEITKREFEKSFEEGYLYNRQTADDSHLKLLLDLIDPKDDETILDLGTGSGYIAFPLAERNQNIMVIGMDILADTLERNTKKAAERGIGNIDFISYDGIAYPIENSSVDTIVTRYALHHFPDIEGSFREMYRALKTDGKLIISDPTPNSDDTAGFIDKFMRIKPDGHIKFYSFPELKETAERNGFSFISRQDTYIRFPRKNPEKYRKLLSGYDEDIVSGYEIKIIEDEIWIKENVFNIVLKKIN